MISPTHITATFEIVTPMFLGGDDQQASLIRASAIKGALAFWWRALNFARFVDKASECQAEALKAMQAEEQRLFGGPKGQGVFLLKAESIPDKWTTLETGQVLAKDGSSFSNPKRNDSRTVGVGARYLGYGILNAFYTKGDKDKNKPKKEAGELERSCIKISSTFILHIIPKPNCPSEDITEILRVIKLFGLLGGLGSRVRRGWGSVVLVDLKGDRIDPFDNWKPPSTPDEYKVRLKEIIGDTLPKVPGQKFRVTAFAKESDIRVGTSPTDSALIALNALGEGLLKYRAWGKPKGKVDNISVDASFVNDHDWFKNIDPFSQANVGRGDYIPARAAFGLPHNYSKLGVTAPGDHDRRASPLMFHITKINCQYYPVAVFMPTQFLNEEKAVVRNEQQGKKTLKNYTFDPDIITDFLDGHPHVDGSKSNGTPKPAGNHYFPSMQVFS
ncbi:type III-B CRISPR module RAMP protein Cmr1 [Thalassospira povalilytica]|uniref:type III-B CRISPR module RAMP protein Cmr1 n=1 Tax=Thalassospira povalilytica TaxID=732237 RepID=UPI003AA90C9E